VYFGRCRRGGRGNRPGRHRTQRSYTPPALDLGTTYFWRVDEVGETGTFEGNLWSFTTQEFLVVDDFESYDDKENRIYEAWIDGEINKTGSTVGYMESVQGTFGERTIVRSGRQSMPMFYDNAEPTASMDACPGPQGQRSAQWRMHHLGARVHRLGPHCPVCRGRLF
jgi:hypothetical protein